MIIGVARDMPPLSAHRFVDEGVSVVLAAIDSEPLRGRDGARSGSLHTLAVRENVMPESDIDRLADRACTASGKPRILRGSAGVAATAATLRARRVGVLTRTPSLL